MSSTIPDLLDDALWSDDEIDYLDNIAKKQDLTHSKIIQSVTIEMSKGNNKGKRQIFSGQIGCTAAQIETKQSEFKIPLPFVPPHINEALGREVVLELWSQFILFGADESKLILVENIAAIGDHIKMLGYDLPFEELEVDEDGDEYIDFLYLLDKLTVKRNKAGVIIPASTIIPQLPPCCATRACFIHRRSDRKFDDESDERPDFRLDVIYRRWVLERKGNVRINDVPAILHDADIAHDEDLLPSHYWIVNGDSLLLNYENLADVASKIRLDRADLDCQMDLYKLPQWLENEFIPQEIAMFRHHFMMIDLDQGGSIDAEELQFLGESLGNKLTLEEAEHLISEHDDDNSGTIDFAEFMGLMFKILRGTVDVENDKLGKAMMESRSQIKLFQEIENIKGIFSNVKSFIINCLY